MKLLQDRRAGILLHPTSLPGSHGGDMGRNAYRFVDFLVDSGCTVWQMLPLGPTHIDGSPYQSLSAHAGNLLLTSLDWLVDKGWLDYSVIEEAGDSPVFHKKCLTLAYHSFVRNDDANWNKRLKGFIKQHKFWLNDYALFVAIKHTHDGLPWNEWPKPLANRNAKALSAARKEYAEDIEQIVFEQFIFFTQWHELREYANGKGVYLFGDMPIFVSYDSADVWSNRKNFLLDKNGDAVVVAGVPPDAFSETGQRWGNPLYDWKYMQSKDYGWWVQRFETQLEMFDLIRIDHFRGLEACWQIAAEEETAINGEWVKSPGRDLLKAVKKNFKSLPLIAEDLGMITDDVIKLRKKYSLPGMKILQFAFDGDNKNIYLPHNHEQLSVTYTGTHDNDTTLGWYQNLNDHAKHYLHRYLGVHETHELDMPWVMNRMALASVANLAILPMQDILSLDSTHRMNTPGTIEDNWQWRFDWDMLWPELTSDLRRQNEVYGRVP